MVPRRPIADEPTEVGEYPVAVGDVMIVDETVVHTAHSPTSEPAVLTEAQLRAGGRRLTEFVPGLATLIGRVDFGTL